MKKLENAKRLCIPAVGAVFFLFLLPVDFEWAPTFLAIKLAVNAVSVVVYVGVLIALRDRRTEPVEHGGLLFVLGLVTLPHFLLLMVFYYNSLICMAVSAGLAAALLVNRLKRRK